MKRYSAFFAIALLTLACSKKNSGNDTGFMDIYPLIAGKWKAVKYEQKTITGPSPGHDTLIINNNINGKGVRFIGIDSVDMIDFISHDTFGVKRTNPNTWYINVVNNSYGNCYIDWYRNQILWLTVTGFNYTYKIVFNNNNSIQIGDDTNSPYNTFPYYKWTYFERFK